MIENRWRDHFNDRIFERPLGIHEGAQKVLACADYSDFGVVGDADRFYAELGGRSVYLYAFLMLAL